MDSIESSTNSIPDLNLNLNPEHTPTPDPTNLTMIMTQIGYVMYEPDRVLSKIFKQFKALHCKYTQHFYRAG